MHTTLIYFSFFYLGTYGFSSITKFITRCIPGLKCSVVTVLNRSEVWLTIKFSLRELKYAWYVPRHTVDTATDNILFHTYHRIDFGMAMIIIHNPYS